MREIRYWYVKRCPHVILVPEHYRDDGSCRCDDRTHGEMVEWGYEWNVVTARWDVPPVPHPAFKAGRRNENPMSEADQVKREMAIDRDQGNA